MPDEVAEELALSLKYLVDGGSVSFGCRRFAGFDALSLV
jgi:hypothetical protein